MQKPSTPPLPITAAPPPLKTAAPKKVTGIVVPASSLSSATVAERDDPAVNIVADKIRNLPALKGKALVESAPAEEQDSYALLTDARQFLEFKNYEEANRLYDQILARDPQNHNALLGKAYALAASGAHDDAVLQLHHVLNAYPHDDVAAANLAHTLTQVGQNEDAIRYLDQAAREAPDNFTYRLNLAALYDRGGHRNEALMLYRQVVEGAESAETNNLPLAAIQKRIDYLAGSATGDAAKPPSTTAPVDN